jgi:hypothetical protein
MQVGAVQPQVTPRAFENVQYRSNDFMGEQLQRLGQATSALAGRIDQARTDTALLEAQDAINKKRRELFDPQTGIYSRQGADAVGVTDLVDRELEAFSENILKSKNLSGSGREAVQRLLMAERQRGYEKAADYEMRAHLDYQEKLQAAHLDAQYDSLFRNPGDQSSRDSAFTNILNSVTAKADQMGFADDTLRDQFIENELTKGLLAVAEGYAVTDPVMADEFLEANQDKGDPRLIQQQRDRLKPQVVEAKAREVTARAINADRTFGVRAADNVDHGTHIEYSMGPNRPNAPSQQIQNVIGTAVADVLGPGVRVVITSGQENDGHQHGSNRHKTGSAADIQIFDAAGNIVKVGSPEMRAIALAAASRGALGIGYGTNYMGDAMHIDMVAPGPGQAHVWEDAKEIESALVTAMRRGEEMVTKTGLEVIMDIEDPDVRDAALTRYRQEQNASYTQKVRASETAATDLITQIGQDMENAALNGTPMPTLDVYLNARTREVLGSNADAVIATYNRKVMGQEVDPVSARETYAFMMRQAVSADPKEREAFATTNLELAAAPFLTGDQMNVLYAKQMEVASSLGLDANNNFVRNLTTTTPYADFDRAVTGHMTAAMKKDAEQVGRVTKGLVEWANIYVTQNGKEPTDLQLNEQARRILYGGEMTIDPAGLRNELSGTMADVYEQLDSRETTIGDLRSAAENGNFKLALPNTSGRLVEVPITAPLLDRMLQRFPNGFAGQPLTPRMVINLLASMDPATVDTILSQTESTR